MIFFSAFTYFMLSGKWTAFIQRLSSYTSDHSTHFTHVNIHTLILTAEAAMQGAYCSSKKKLMLIHTHGTASRSKLGSSILPTGTSTYRLRKARNWACDLLISGWPGLLISHKPQFIRVGNITKHSSNSDLHLQMLGDLQATDLKWSKLKQQGRDVSWQLFTLLFTFK